jgi:hypothetical protein
MDIDVDGRIAFRKLWCFTDKSFVMSVIVEICMVCHANFSLLTGKLFLINKIVQPNDSWISKSVTLIAK